MKIYRRLAWFFSLFALGNNMMFMLLLLIIYNNMEKFNKLPAHQNYDGLLIAFLFICWFSYIIACYSIVKMKKQAEMFRGFGLLGFLGLIICLLLPNKNKPAPPPPPEPQPDPEETILVEPIRLKTVDGKIVNIKMKNDKPVEVQIEESAQSGHAPSTDVHHKPDAHAPKHPPAGHASSHKPATPPSHSAHGTHGEHGAHH